MQICVLLLFWILIHKPNVRCEKLHSNFYKKNQHLSVDSAKKVTIMIIEVRDKSKDIP